MDRRTFFSALAGAPAAAAVAKTQEAPRYTMPVPAGPPVKRPKPASDKMPWREIMVAFEIEAPRCTLAHIVDGDGLFVGSLCLSEGRHRYYRQVMSRASTFSIRFGDAPPTVAAEFDWDYIKAVSAASGDHPGKVLLVRCA